MKTRFGADVEAIGQLVPGNPHLVGDQPVQGGRLVGGARHQRVEGRVHACRAIALEDEDVERVEGLEILVAAGVLDLQRQRAAPRRGGVHIGEMRKIGGQGEFAEGREPIGLGLALGRDAPASPGEGGERAERGGAELDGLAACKAHATSSSEDRDLRPCMIRVDYVAFSRGRQHGAGKSSQPPPIKKGRDDARPRFGSDQARLREPWPEQGGAPGCRTGSGDSR
jgi:hypothetical protein